MFPLNGTRVRQREMQTVHPKLWQNWSGIVRSVPEKIVYPATIEDVVSVVNECREKGRKLRIVGAGHSFTPLAMTNDVLMSLDAMSGLIEVNATNRVASLWAGTRLYELGPLLWRNGLAMENLGDIDAQSIAGAISTGTHGTGGKYGILANQVIEITAVLGTGEVVTCSKTSQPDLFHALLVSLGALGVIVKLKLQCVKAFRLKYESRRVPLDECLNSLDCYRNDYRHFEFYCFPYSKTCQVKLMSETDTKVTSHPVRDYFNKIIMENWAFGALSFACRSMPGLCRPVSRFSAGNVPVGTEVGESYELFATPRLVKFNEMEYNIPASELATVVREVLERIEQEQIPVHFPIECRYVRADDIPISPANGRDSAYVAVHMYKGMPHEAYFRAMEEIFLRHNGRPHWGKMHYLNSAKLSERYPAWQQFLAIREEADPDGVFLTPYLKTLFGLDLDGHRVDTDDDGASDHRAGNGGLSSDAPRGAEGLSVDEPRGGEAGSEAPGVHGTTDEGLSVDEPRGDEGLNGERPDVAAAVLQSVVDSPVLRQDAASDGGAGLRQDAASDGDAGLRQDAASDGGEGHDGTEEAGHKPQS